MRICFVSPANNYHTLKWCQWFITRGHEVHIISFVQGNIEGATVHWIDTSVNVTDKDFKKVKYLSQGKKIKKIINAINPDIVNAHYATSYGTALALSGVHNYILSVWGSDVYDFPRKSILHKWMLEYSLNKADCLFSTSNAMATEASKYTKKKFEITPFGVDMKLFSPGKRTRDQSKNRDYIVGTIKALTPKYGIDFLLKAIAIVRKKYPCIPIKLRIAGTGSHEKEYKELSKVLKIDDIVTWLGFISQEKAADEWANMDVGIVVSTLDSESFGVSAVEAQASGLPVIVSDVPGLMEATLPGYTSIVVQRKDESALAEAIAYLYYNPLLRVEMGKKGRQFVQKKYELNYCFERIEQLFQKYNE